MHTSKSAALFTQHYPRDSLAFTDLVNQTVFTAMLEDIGSGDLTALLIPEENMAEAFVISRQDAIICGIDWFEACFHHVNKDIKIKWLVNEGEKVATNQLLCKISGNARVLLTAERTALNFLQLLSAVATHTRQFVLAASGTKVEILDTRKTIPGLRLPQKYAVTVGGGSNQRLALYDGILIKENHIAAAGSIAAALAQAAKLNKNTSIQIEVENMDELQQALIAGATSILLDNFSIAEMREAVEITNGRALLEASGNVDLSSVRAIALTGVNRISIGAITKNISAIDLSMRIK